MRHGPMRNALRALRCARALKRHAIHLACDERRVRSTRPRHAACAVRPPRMPRSSSRGDTTRNTMIERLSLRARDSTRAPLRVPSQCVSMYTVSPYSARTSSVGTMIVAASASATRRVPRGAALDLGTSSFPETTAPTGTAFPPSTFTSEQVL